MRIALRSSAIAAATAVLLLASPAAAKRSAPHIIAVSPLSSDGSLTNIVLHQLTTVLVTAATQALAGGANGLLPLDKLRAVEAAMRKCKSASPACALGAATRAGATAVLSGMVKKEGSGFGLALNLVNVATGKTLASHKSKVSKEGMLKKAISGACLAALQQAGLASDNKAADDGPADEPLPPAIYAKGVGFSVRKLTDKEQTSLGRNGVMVTDVLADLPAREAGLKKGDVISGVDSGTVRDPKELVELVTDGDEGQTFTLSVLRDGKDQLVRLKLPGESEEEREKREEEEREISDQEEAAEKAEEEAAEKAEEEAAEKAEEEAAEKAEEAVAEEDDDLFGFTGCCICSALCPIGAPVFLAAAIFVEAESPPPPPSESPTTVVRY